MITLMQLCDASMLVLGALSIWLINRDGGIKRWAPVAGIMAQLPWLYIAWANGQRGMFILGLVYLIIWAQSLRKMWLGERS